MKELCPGEFVKGICKKKKCSKDNEIVESCLKEHGLKVVKHYEIDDEEAGEGYCDYCGYYVVHGKDCKIKKIKDFLKKEKLDYA